MMDMTTERPTAVHALHDGDRAYYAHGSGNLLPCTIDHEGVQEGWVCVRLEVNDDFCVILRTSLVHPDAIHGHHFAGGPRILGRTVYMGAR